MMFVRGDLRGEPSPRHGSDGVCLDIRVIPAVLRATQEHVRSCCLVPLVDRAVYSNPCRWLTAHRLLGHCGRGDIGVFEEEPDQVGGILVE